MAFALGCQPQDEPRGTLDVRTLNMTGTWRYMSERQQYKASTGEYLSSIYYDHTVILEETDYGVRVERC